MKTAQRLIHWAFAVALVICVLNAPAARAGNPDVTWTASIKERPTEEIVAAAPLKLGREDDQIRIVVDITNNRDDELRIRSVRLDGRVMGMAFYSFSTRVDIVLAPDETIQRRIDLDLDDLTDQAVGLIPSRMSLTAPDRKVIDSKPFPVDVKGSLISVYGIFGLVVAGMTVAVLVLLLIDISRRRLPVNRWQRAVRFLPAGVGIGLTLTFTLSALGLLLPNAASWLTFVLVMSLGALLFGYFLPIGQEDHTDNHDERWLVAPDGEPVEGAPDGAHP